MFVDELIAAYPNAKVILTNRDPDKWLASILSTIYVILSWDWERRCIPYIMVRLSLANPNPSPSMNETNSRTPETRRQNNIFELHHLHAHDHVHPNTQRRT